MYRGHVVFFRYLLSYLITLLLPLSVIMVFLFVRFISVLEQEALDSAAASAAKIETVLDMTVRDVYRLPMQLALNSALAPFSQEASNYEKYLTVRELRKHASSREILSLLVLYRRGDPFVYSNAGVFDLRYFNRVVYHYESWPHATFLDEINTVSAPRVRPAEWVRVTSGANSRIITYLFSVPPNTNGAYATALVMISDDAVKRLMGLESQESMNTIVLDSNGAIVTSTYDLGDLQAAQIRSIPKAMSGERQGIYTVGTERSFVAYRLSEATGWGYLTIMPVRHVLESVRMIQTQTVGILAGVLLLGLGLILLSMRANYSPIERFTAFVNTLSGEFGASEDSGTADIEYIHNAFRGLVGDLNGLALGLSGSRSAARELLITNLITGRIPTVLEFNQRGEQLGIGLRGHRFAVLVMAPENGRKETAQLIASLERIVPRHLDGYGKWDPDAGQVLFAVAGDQLSDEQLVQFARIALVGLDSRETQKWFVGIGSSRTSISELGRSYVEACAALEYRTESVDKNTFSFSRSGPFRLSLGDYPWSELQEIQMLSLSGDIAGISKIVEAFGTQTGEDPLSLFAMRHFALEVTAILMQALSHGEVAIQNLDWQALDATRFTRCHSLSELRRALLDACAVVTPYFSRPNSEGARDHEIHARLLAYIQENFARFDFSLESVAEQFAMSSSSLSRHFKQLNGLSFSETVHAFRVREAQRLLKKTDLAIEVIASRVGFASSSSFIRMFRKLAGVTPGQFRQQDHRATVSGTVELMPSED